MGWKIVFVVTVFWPISFAQAQTFAQLSAEANAARASDRLEEAKALYKKALDLKADWPEGWWALGTIAYDENDYKEAEIAFNKAADLDPKSGSARIMLGLSEFELGEEDKALKHIQEGEQIGVAEDQQLRQVALFHEGILLQRAGRFEEAERALNSLCLAGVQTPELDTTLGLVSLRMTESKPSDMDAVKKVGQASCLATKKEFEAARRSMDDVVREYPRVRNIHTAYGRLLLDAQDRPAALAEFSREIENYPGDIMARLQIAAADYKQDSSAGLAYAQAATKLAPDVAQAHYLFGLLLLDTDQYQAAIPELEKARERMKHVPGVFSALGLAYARAGRDEEAMRARSIAQQLSKSTASSPAPQP